MRTEVSEAAFRARMSEHGSRVVTYMVRICEPQCVAYALDTADGPLVGVRELTSQSAIPGPDRFYLVDEDAERKT